MANKTGTTSSYIKTLVIFVVIERVIKTETIQPLYKLHNFLPEVPSVVARHPTLADCECIAGWQERRDAWNRTDNKNIKVNALAEQLVWRAK